MKSLYEEMLEKLKTCHPSDIFWVVALGIPIFLAAMLGVIYLGAVVTKYIMVSF